LQLSPRENTDIVIDPKELELFRSYYSSLMYKVSECMHECGAVVLPPQPECQ
jgi:hypothetical protein